MNIIKGEKFSYFDVDDTLVMWDYDFQKYPELHVTLQEPWIGYDRPITLSKNTIAINALIDAKERGDTIVVWSQGGWDWALEVVTKLGLTDFVDCVMSKPHEFYDDCPAERFMHTRIDPGAEYYKRKTK